MCVNCNAPICPPPGRIVPSHWTHHLPFAFWLVDILRPTLLVELGTYYGASFCAFCQEIERLRLGCQAYAIDCWKGDRHMGTYGDEVFLDLEEYIASHYAGFACLLRMDFDEALNQFLDGTIDLLHLDGLHSSSAILHDFETWLPKLSLRGVVLIHDICARYAGFGGAEAWRILSSRYPSFSFRHGYGLGVALVGPEVPKALQELASLPEDCDILLSFQEQGKIYDKLFKLEARRKSEAEQAQKREAELRDIIANLEHVINDERAARQTQAAKFKQELLKEQLLNRDLTKSLSWRFTAPLRKLAALCGLH